MFGYVGTLTRIENTASLYQIIGLIGQNSNGPHDDGKEQVFPKSLDSSTKELMLAIRNYGFKPTCYARGKT
jgi:hypothetical protein